MSREKVREFLASCSEFARRIDRQTEALELELNAVARRSCQQQREGVYDAKTDASDAALDTLEEMKSLNFKVTELGKILEDQRESLSSVLRDSVTQISGMYRLIRFVSDYAAENYGYSPPESLQSLPSSEDDVLNRIKDQKEPSKEQEEEKIKEVKEEESEKELCIFDLGLSHEIMEKIGYTFYEKGETENVKEVLNDSTNIQKQQLDNTSEDESFSSAVEAVEISPGLFVRRRPPSAKLKPCTPEFFLLERDPPKEDAKAASDIPSSTDQKENNCSFDFTQDITKSLMRNNINSEKKKGERSPPPPSLSSPLVTPEMPKLQAWGKI